MAIKSLKIQESIQNVKFVEKNDVQEFHKFLLNFRLLKN